jgi:hypothetical protein
VRISLGASVASGAHVTIVSVHIVVIVVSGGAGGGRTHSSAWAVFADTASRALIDICKSGRSAVGTLWAGVLSA